MNLGTAYYPEHCKAEQWPIDYKKICDAGITRIRIGEFAWSRLEPKKGVFQWEWLDQSIDLAAQYRLEVVLCTPTACPPIWLIEEYPEVLPVDKFGRRTVFGARQHRCYNTPEYLEYSYKIIEEMAKRYGNHPNVVAWQLDNEFGGEQKRCYCDNCKEAFHSTLEEKYSCIEQLNERWGNSFWSQEYSKWSQIPTPIKYAGDLSLKCNPSLDLEYSRFASAAIVNFSRKQISILRNYIGQRLITTNLFMFNWGDNVNWVELVRDLDVAGIDIYSDKTYETAFFADVTRSVKPDHFWTMEYGACTKDITQGLDLLAERGCDWTYLFKFKPFPFGQEQSMREMVSTTGVETPNYFKIQEWADKSEQMASKSIEKEASGIGLYWNFDSSWAYTYTSWDDIPQSLKYQNYFINVVYRSMYTQEKTLKIVFSADGIEGIHTLVVPMHLLYDVVLEEKLIQFVKDGGKLVVTSDLFQKNQDNLFMEYVPVIYKELFGVAGNDFVYKEDYDEGTVLLHHNKIGKGSAYMVRLDASHEQWFEIMEFIGR